MTLDRLRRAAATWEQQILEGVANYQGAVAVEIVKRMAVNIPVDKGIHRGATRVSVGAPAFQISNTPDPSGRRAIAQAQLVASQVQPGQKVYITNNGPVIADLDRGLSEQAPNGWSRQSIGEGVAAATVILQRGFLRRTR